MKWNISTINAKIFLLPDCMAQSLDRRFPVQYGEEFYAVCMRLAKSSGNYPANSQKYVKDRQERERLLDRVTGSPTLKTKLISGGLLAGVEYDMQPMCLGIDRTEGWYGVFEAYGPGSGQDFELKQLLIHAPAKAIRTVHEIMQPRREPSFSGTVGLLASLYQQVSDYRAWAADFNDYWQEPHNSDALVNDTIKTGAERSNYLRFLQVLEAHRED